MPKPTDWKKKYEELERSSETLLKSAIAKDAELEAIEKERVFLSDKLDAAILSNNAPLTREQAIRKITDILQLQQQDEQAEILGKVVQGIKTNWEETITRNSSLVDFQRQCVQKLQAYL